MGRLSLLGLAIMIVSLNLLFRRCYLGSSTPLHDLYYHTVWLFGFLKTYINNAFSEAGLNVDKSALRTLKSGGRIRQL
jgi:hypothetical protein